MYIIMKKIKEDEIYVSYCFEKDIWAETGEKDRRGFSIAESKTITGICTFNKRTKEVVVNAEQTDPYYFEKGRREIIWVGVQLLRFRDEGGIYPQVYTIAKG
jgi:hypothetical protein